MALAAGAGLAGLAYILWPKKRIPASAVVEPFHKEKYVGLWQEIARLPNRVEKNLKNLTDEYSLKEDGNIKVITRAYNFEKNKPVEAEGTIKFAGRDTRGKMRAFYTLPIRLDYNILDIDATYRYALISGNSTDHLWIISRESNIPVDIRHRFLSKAADLGFDITKLEWMNV